AVGREEATQQLQLWPASLALGQPLPTLPLWIAADFSVPLDLGASYEAACTDLRIRQAAQCRGRFGRSPRGCGTPAAGFGSHPPEIFPGSAALLSNRCAP